METFTFRPNPDVADALIKVSNVLNCTKSALINEALRVYLSQPISVLSPKFSRISEPSNPTPTARRTV